MTANKEERVQKVQAVIDRLELEPKQGQSYDDKGRHGWRNPVRADTGAILEALVLARRPRRILEIGTARGLSGCYLARALPEDGEMTTIEWDEETAQLAQANFDAAGLNVRVLTGDAMSIIPVLDRQYHFVFLDANKDGYLEQFLELLKGGFLHPDGCTIVADNVIDRKTECQNFLDAMRAYPHVVIQTECGLLVAHV